MKLPARPLRPQAGFLVFLLSLISNHRSTFIAAWNACHLATKSFAISQTICACKDESTGNCKPTPNSPSFTRLTHRRNVLDACTLVFGSTFLPLTTPCHATDDSSSRLSIDDIVELLHSTPTFCLVDPNGVPYMVVGEDAKVTGYFFTSFGEAQRVLQLAKKSAAQAIKKAKQQGEDDVGDNPWTKARISTVPLDTAVTLVYKSNRVRGIYFKVAPSTDDINDALFASGQEDLPEGKVPLFYYEEFKDGNGKSPLYFRKIELEQAWRKANPKQAATSPELLVTELFSVLAELAQPTKGNAIEEEELRNLVLVPPKESESKAKECSRRSGDTPPFIIGQRIIVL
jgi:hypothetical protein